MENQYNTAKRFRYKIISYITLIIYLLQPITILLANPQTTVAPNGVEIVEINAPNQNGLSHNQYDQFNVKENGLIFNNSGAIANTTLAGYILGNPNIGTNPARVILNEVMGTQPSYLNGYMEIAGRKAELIIANPNGIIGNGFGFINVSKAMLTTGTPTFGNQGILDGFNVNTGTISIQGQGLNANAIDRVDLLAKAVEVNAGIWANQLNVVTGDNVVDNDLNIQSTNQNENGSVALDVGVLGGMYANKIKLIGTQNGVGVNSKGTIVATDSLKLNQQGKIFLEGTTLANQELDVLTQDELENQGQIHTDGNLNVQSQKSLVNTGIFTAAKNMSIQADELQSKGTIGAGIKEDGTVDYAGDLYIHTQNKVRLNGENFAGGDIKITGTEIDQAGAKTIAGKNITLTTTKGNINTATATLQAGEKLNISANGALNNNQAKEDKSSQITAKTINITAQKINNKQGIIQQTGSEENAVIIARDIDNSSGKIVNAGDSNNFNITAKQEFINTNGTISSNASLKINTSTIENKNDHITAQKEILMNVEKDFIHQGNIETNGNLSITAQNIKNTKDGIINADKTNIKATNDITNEGRIEGNEINTSSRKISNYASIIGNQVTINAQTIENQGEKAIIGAVDTLNLWAGDQLLNQNGANIISMNDINIAVDEQKNEDGYLINKTQNVTNKGATIEAGNNLSLSAQTVKNQASEDLVVGTTDTTSTKVLTMAPHVKYREKKRIGNKYITIEKEYGGGWNGGNERNGLYVRIYMTVPKENIISYDAKTQSLYFNDITQTDTYLLEGEEFCGIKSADELNLFFTEILTKPIGIGGKTVEYTRNRGDYKITPMFTGQSNKGEDLSRPSHIFGVTGGKYKNSIAITTWDGKEAGKTMAYCDTLQINQNGDYEITFYPGYIPGVYLYPGEGRRTMPTYHTDASAEERRTTTTTTQTEYIISEPTPGKIQVGQDMKLNIEGDFENQCSKIAVGNAVTGHIGTLQNKGYQLKEKVTSTEESYFHDYFKTGGGLSGGHVESSDGYKTFGPFVETKYIDGGIASTFTAKSISLTGENLSNIQNSNIQTPIGATIGKPTVGTVVTEQINQEINNQEIKIKLPQNSLYEINTSPTAKYIIETNPRFTDYKKFISSEYLLSRLNYDQSKLEKRLGDAYYEQKLINEQILNETNKQYLSGYENNDEEYQALMDAAIEETKNLKLTIGIALTKEQIAALKQDIVWLVEEEITLPDGTKQKVLMPKVYFCQANHLKLEPTGALIAADTINLTLSGNLTNNATIAGVETTEIQADNILNQNAGKIGQAGKTTLVATTDIINQSGQIIGDKITLQAGRDIKNQTITEQIEMSQKVGDHIWSGNNTIIGTTANIEAKDALSITAGRDVTAEAGQLSADTIEIDARRNLTIGTVVSTNQGADKAKDKDFSYESIQNVTSQIKGNNITIQNLGDMNLNAAQIQAEDNLSIKTEGNLNITNQKDQYQQHQSYNGKKGSFLENITDETNIGSKIEAGNNITIETKQNKTNQIAGNINITASTINSQNGTIDILSAGQIEIQNDTEKHEFYQERHSKDKGLLSSTTTDSKDYELFNQVKQSNISGSKIDIQSKKDLTIKASNIIADENTNLQAKENIHIISAEQTDKQNHYYHESKSGIFGSGGLGFTIGSQKQKDSYDNQAVEQVGSTIGSIGGNVNLESGKDVDIKASEVIAGKDINITGENVTIENGDNTYNAQEKHEFKQSGLSVSLGGKTIDAAQSVIAPLERAGQVEDDRLKQLYQYKAAEAGKENKETLTDLANGKTDIGLSVSLGTSKAESSYQSDTTLNQGSSLYATGDVNIKATEKDITVKSSAITGENVNLEAKENINVIAGTNKNVGNGDSSQSSASIGVSIGFSGISGINAGYNKANGEVKENAEIHVASTITAQDTLTTKSGQDTNIIGSKLEGNTVKMEVGKDLNIESLQDKETYDEKNSNSGFNFSADIKANADTGKNQFQNGGLTGGTNKGKTNSTYKSVTDQAGIYAGKGGFDIEVGKNTDLKGAVISSEATADKNKLSTDTLTYSDIENKAEYEASSSGVAYDSRKYDKGDPNYKNQGATPVVGTSSNGEADSTTKAAIADGTIEIRSNPQQNIANLSRDTENALNALDKIFDKKTVQEQQELAQLFGEVANNEIHRISKELGWDDGSTYKVLLHAAIAGTTAKLGGSDFKSGAISGAVNEIFINEIAKLGDPALMQWASYILGKTVAKLTHGNAETGGNVAASATKNNFLHFFMEDIIKSLDLDALNDDEYYLITGNFRGVAGGCIVAKNKVVYDVYSLDVAEFKFSKKTPNIKELFQFGNASTGKMLNFDSTFDAPDYSDKVTNYLTGPSIFGSLQGPLINGNFSFGGSGFQSEFGFNLSVPDKPKFSFGGSYVDEIGRIDSEDTWIWE